MPPAAAGAGAPWLLRLHGISRVMKQAGRSLALVLGCDVLYWAGTAALLAGRTAGVREYVAPQGSWWLWGSDALWRARPLLAGAAVLLSLAGWQLARRVRPDSTASRPAWGLPLALAPVPALAWLYRDALAPAWFASLLFYAPLALLALWLTRLMSPRPAGAGPRPGLHPPAHAAAWIWLGAAVFYFWTGLYYTRCCGPHAGDENHFLIQAESLYRDHDLDLRNNLDAWLGPDALGRLGSFHLHISPFSSPPHAYSYHSPGLPFLLAPAVPGGLAACHAVLGCIAGAACAAMWLLCRRAGAAPPACGVMLAGFCLSLYWCVYASRVLPETLGAALAAWLAWAILAQREYPWRTAVIAGACCAALPWAYIRFLPLALAGVALYPPGAARTPEPGARRAARLALFAILGVGGLILFRWGQARMFSGGFSHEVDRLFFACPSGLWRVFTNPNGLLNTFPMALWLGAAAALSLGAPPGRRRMTAILSGMAALYWLSTCAVPNYGGGSTLGGRFLVAVMPLLLPAARGWLLFLALVSVALCALQLLALPALGRSFACPFSELPVVLPALHGLRYPFCGSAHALAMAALTLLIIGLRRPGLSARVAGLAVILSLGWHAAGPPCALPVCPPRAPTDPARVARALAGLDLDRIRVSRPVPGAGAALFEISNLLLEDDGHGQALSVTTRDLGARQAGRLVCQPRLETNDWSGRPYRWTTLAPPFRPGRGQRAFLLEGRLEGPAQAVLAVREGAETILEEPLAPDPAGAVRFKAAVRTRGDGADVYLLLRLDGEGTFYGRRLAWSPVSVRLLEQAGLSW